MSTAHQVEAVLDGRSSHARRARCAALTPARYAIRYERRSTPFGFFAGVCLSDFGETSAVYVGGDHEIVARADPRALDEAISAREADAALMADVEVCVNNLAYVLGRVPEHVVVEGCPFTPWN
ncbi:lantibiotic dehydratase [Nonomuraea sp. B19D2]|uniref:lantibiotic dehydratase n=1 Tax=Nonomuraea sp. B19D2 TaxID=3159561 RepID=UPI0032DB7BED